MKNNYFLSVAFLSILFVAFGCSKDDDSSGSKDFDGSIQSIEDFLTPDAVDALQELGFIINTGNNPPNVEGVFYSNSKVLLATSVPNDNSPGHSFNNQTISFSNQNNSNLTVVYDGLESEGSTSEGNGTFIAGDGDLFTVLVKVNAVTSGQQHTGLEAFSGKMTPDGIENYRQAILMVDDMGDPNDVIIPNNTGRVFRETDGLVERTN